MQVLIGVLIGLLSAAAYGGNNIVVRKSSKEMPLFFGILYSSWQAVAIGSVIFFIIFAAQLPSISSNALLITLTQGLLGAFLGRFCLFRSIHLIGAARSSQIYATQPAITSVIAAIFLGEFLGPLNYLGMLLVIIGIVVLYNEEKFPSAQIEINEDKRTMSKSQTVRGFLYGLAAAVLYGVSNVFGKVAVTLMPSPFLVTIISAAVPLILSLLFIGFFRKTFVNVKEEPFFASSKKYYTIAGFLISIGMLCFFGAMKFLPASIVATLQSTNPIFTILFSSVFLKDTERVTLRTLISAILVVVGVTLILSV